MVRILVLLASVIDGVPYQHLVNLIQSLPNSNDDFGFAFDAWSAATGTEANEPLLPLRTGPTSVGKVAACANTACSASGR